MAFGGFDKGGGQAPMAEINMIPLIDVMLVLLVIFIITAPLLTHAVKVELPKAASQVNLTKPDNIQLAIDRAGTVFWNGESVGVTEWRARMAEAAKLQPQPEIHLRADGEVAYSIDADGYVTGTTYDAYGNVLTTTRYANALNTGAIGGWSAGQPLSLAQLEAAYISETLAATGGNKTECARILGISRKNLYEKIARYEL